MNLLACLTRPRMPARTAPARPRAVPDEAAEDIHPACGWFDSSHELQQGLSVREHASAESLAAELPLTQWLELHLQAWRPALPS